MVKSKGLVLNAKPEASSYFANIPVLHVYSDGKSYKIALVPYDSRAQNFLRVPPGREFKAALEIFIPGLGTKFVFDGMARIEDFRETKEHIKVEIESRPQKERFLLVFDKQSAWNFEMRVGRDNVVGQYEFVIDY